MGLVEKIVSFVYIQKQSSRRKWGQDFPLNKLGDWYIKETLHFLAAVGITNKFLSIRLNINLNDFKKGLWEESLSLKKLDRGGIYFW